MEPKDTAEHSLNHTDLISGSGQSNKTYEVLLCKSTALQSVMSS